MLGHWKTSQSGLIRKIYKEEEEKMERVISENKANLMFQEYDLLPHFLNFQLFFGELKVLEWLGKNRIFSFTVSKKHIESFVCPSYYGLGEKEEGESGAGTRSAKLWAWK